MHWRPAIVLMFLLGTSATLAPRSRQPATAALSSATVRTVFGADIWPLYQPGACTFAAVAPLAAGSGLDFTGPHRRLA